MKTNKLTTGFIIGIFIDTLVISTTIALLQWTSEIFRDVSTFLLNLSKKIANSEYAKMLDRILGVTDEY